MKSCFLTYSPKECFFSTLLYVKDSKDRLLCNEGLPRPSHSKSRHLFVSDHFRTWIVGQSHGTSPGEPEKSTPPQWLQHHETGCFQEDGRPVCASYTQEAACDFLVLCAQKQVSTMRHGEMLQKAKERQAATWTLFLFPVIKKPIIRYVEVQVLNFYQWGKKDFERHG